MKTITFCFTSERARELYNGKPPQYETPFASGFDLRAIYDNIFYVSCQNRYHHKMGGYGGGGAEHKYFNTREEAMHYLQYLKQNRLYFAGGQEFSIDKYKFNSEIIDKTDVSFHYYYCDSMLQDWTNIEIIEKEQEQVITPHNRILIKTGIRVAMPIMENQIMELQIRSRSGLALKNGICVLNGIGTIDNDFRGELGVILYNAGHEPFMINIGDRIAQGIFNPLQQCIWQEVSQEDFDKNFYNTQRGSGGFGSTGT